MPLLGGSFSMNPLIISAQFAAYIWFGEHRDNANKSNADAMRFARDNWQGFLPLAQPGLGTLLLKIAKLPRPARKLPGPPVSKTNAKSLAGAAFSRN
jgi:hypothetical protein